MRESHIIATKVRGEIKDSLSWVADVLIHVEPSPVVAVGQVTAAFDESKIA